MFVLRTILKTDSFFQFAPSVRASGNRHSRGFTLVELMVVIAIISVLATLISMAFNNTAARSQKVACLNNLKQLQTAWLLYLDENEDRLPLNRSVASPLPEQLFGRRNSSNSWVCGNPKEDVTAGNIVKGTLFPHTGKSVGVYRCPADRSTVLGRPDVLRTRSYSMSAYLNGDDPNIARTRESELVNPSPDRIFVFIEEHPESEWLGAFWVQPKDRLSIASMPSWMSTPSDRHNQGCGLSFVDGHVEYWKWFWPKRANLETKLTANTHELRDLRRLQDCVPKP